jgi:hypothetical protein
MEGSKSNAETLLIAFYYLPENTSGVQRAVRIAKYLPKYGCNCSVICSGDRETPDSSAGVFHVPSQSTASERTLRLERWATSFQRRVLPYDERLPWVPHAVAKARELVRNQQASSVISTSPPVATHLAALRMKQQCGLRWIADFRDPILGNPGRARRWALPYDSFLQKQIFRNADAVVAVTDSMADRWKAAYPQWAHKFHVIWNGFDPEDGFGAKPIPARTVRICSHVGVLYALRHPTAMLCALDHLTQDGAVAFKTTKIRFTGPIQKEQELLEQPAVRSLIQHGYLEIRNELIPRAEAMEEIATSDFLFLIDIVDLSHEGYTVPAKLYDYILTGRPILALTQKESPVERILTRSGPRCVCIYHDDSQAEMTRKLLIFFSLPTYPMPLTEWFLSTFDGERQAGDFARLLKDS